MDDIEIEDEPAYSTAHEIAFLKGLGSYSGRGPYLNRRDLLQKYLESCFTRSVWGGISQHECIAFAQQELAKLSQQEEGGENKQQETALLQSVGIE